MSPAKRKAGKDKPKAAEAKILILEHLALGESITAALHHVGRTREAYYQWCREDAGFKERAMAIRARVAANDGQALPAEGKLGFVDFRKKYFGLDTFPHQHVIVDAMESAPPGSITMIILPPEAGKTSVVEDHICWGLAYNPSLRCAVISEGVTHANKILGKIKARMEDDSRFFEYHRAFGPFHSSERAIARSWNAGQIKLLQASSDERDYSIECKGSNSTVYGARYDRMYLDDIQSIKNLNQTNTLLDKFRQDWLTRPGKAGKVFITGTRVGQGDFYGELVKMNPDIRVVHIPAIETDEETGERVSYFPAVYRDAAGELEYRQHEADEDEDVERVISDAGEPLGWTLEELDKRRRDVGDGIFELVYLMETKGSVLQTFLEPELRDCSDRAFAPGPPHRGFGPIIAIDPALAGVCAFLVASFDFEHIYVEDLIAAERLGRNEAIYDILEILVQKHHPSHVIIEANTLQGGIARDDRLLAMGRKYGFVIREHQTRHNKWDQTIGLKSMSAAFKRREILFSTGGKPNEQPGDTLFEPLIEQLIAWREDLKGKHVRTDMVMALWFAWIWWLEMRHTMAQPTTRLSRQGLPGFAGRGLPGFSRRKAS